MPIKYKCAHIIPLYQQGGEVLKQKELGFKKAENYK